MLFDLSTRKLTIARNKEEAVRKKDSNSNLIDLNLEEEQRKYNTELSLIKPEDKHDFLRNKFEVSSLVMADFNEEVDIERYWSVLKSGYQKTAEGYNEGSRELWKGSLRELMENTELADYDPYLVSDMNRDQMNIDFGIVDAEGYKDYSAVDKIDEFDKAFDAKKDSLVDLWQNKIQRYKRNQIQYTKENESLKRMYLLNEGIGDIEKPTHLNFGLIGVPTNWSALGEDVKSIVNPWSSDYFTSMLVGTTDREIGDEMLEVYNNLGIETTPEEQEVIDRTWSESVNGALLPMNKMMIEFGAINKFASVYGIEASFAQVVSGLNKGKWVKHGKSITDQALRARAAQKGMNAAKYAETIGLRQTSSIGNKFLQTSAFGLYEGGKFELFTQFDMAKMELKPEFLETSGFSTGFGFGAVGRMISPLAPLLQRKGLLKDYNKSIIYKPGIGKTPAKSFAIQLNSRKLFETFVTQPASFVVGAEGGEFSDAIVNL